MTARIPAAVADEIAGHLDAIGNLFKHPKVTLIVRAPQLGDGDIILTNDDLDAAIAAIGRLKDRQATQV